jgi:phosphatidylglycerol:prolipoprotein diacylglycerol transferase
MQAIARWGNFFNQELYGPPTSAPWGIAIDCEHRAGTPYPCSEFPAETTGFHPLFFYESALTFSGFLVATYLNRRHFGRLRDGDIVSFWFIWYGATRTLLEVFRTGYNWTIAGIPTAMLIGVAAMAGGALTIWWRHRRPRPAAPEPVSDETAGSDEPAARAVAETATGTEVEAETRPGRAATPADMEQRA